MPGIRAVLDTNVLVSGVAYPKSIPGRILWVWQQGGLEVILSRYILDELVRVLPRLPRVQLSKEQIRDLADSFLFLATIVEPDSKEEERLRDAADQKVLATFRQSQADYLITGDKDLLVLADEYPIITPAAFWARHACEFN